MTNKQALTVEAINQAFAGTNFGRDDLKNILAETVIDAAAGWRCGYTATTICTQLGLLTPKGRASALGLRFISEHVQRETKRLKDELEAMKRANAAQDSHINQQQNRIDQLEKGHSEAAKQINSWRKLAKQNIAEREKDLSELDIARKRIAELEAREVKVKQFSEFQICHYGATEDYAKGYIDCQKNYNKALGAAGILVSINGEG